MTKYVKKPVVIDAFQFEKDCDYPDWVDFTIVRRIADPSGETYKLEIHTIGGIMTANWGDWIIKGIKGEFYPCRNDIFETIYEKVQ